jgi:4-deoxy-L-threo-5-hexosulose-uronate ketol-isomerase
MDLLPAHDVETYSRMKGPALTRAYTMGNLFSRGRVVLRQWETDRTVVGGVIPLGTTLDLPNPPDLRAQFFNERRELGVLSIGGRGTVTVDGRRFALGKLDMLYVGRGAKRVRFASARKSDPAVFYLLSYPAHAAYPTRLARANAVPALHLGANETHNKRSLYRVIHKDGIKSCQLVMGFTVLSPGSVWNTMPPHTHLRRSEVYMYFDLPRGAHVTHFMGPAKRVRRLRMRNRQAVVSPPWSIHCGKGSAHYTFCWGMGGENQEFTDMDPVDPRVVR